jgi:HlyD family secretion protein
MSATKRKKKSNKTLYIALGAIVALLLVLVVLKQLDIIGKEPVKKVQMAAVSPTTITEKVSASGRIQPVDEVSISPEVSGEIRELYIEEGDSIKAGELICVIRPDNFISAVDRTVATLNSQKANLSQTQARMKQVEANFRRAEADFQRNEQLYKDKVISTADFETSKANYEAAKADLDAANQTVQAARFNVASSEANVRDAQENLGLTRIYSPLSGVVTRLNVEKGERVLGTSQMQGTELLRVANLNAMEVRVNVNENDIIRVSIGDTAIVDVDAYSYTGDKFRGIVSAIANSARETASADAVTEFEVRVYVLNESYSNLVENSPNQSPFRPGMTASVDIVTEQKSGILTVPLSAVTLRKPSEAVDKTEGEDEDDETDAVVTTVSSTGLTEGSTESDEPTEVVFVNVDGVARIRQVKTGISDFDNIEILSGLKEGEQVVKGPFSAIARSLKHGDKIEEGSSMEGGGRPN